MVLRLFQPPLAGCKVAVRIIALSGHLHVLGGVGVLVEHPPLVRASAFEHQIRREVITENRHVVKGVLSVLPVEHFLHRGQVVFGRQTVVDSHVDVCLFNVQIVLAMRRSFPRF